ncbi:MAG: hypothetical protein U0797_28065 [Gemmataceae bacterium]
MKGNIRMAAALVGVALSAAAAQAQCPTCPTGGCPDGGGKANKATSGLDLTGYNNYGLYDRCWFQRYTNLAHRAVNRAMAPQVQNGHVLDQTVWNHMFEPGSDLLNPLGQAHLQYVSRRRPEVDRTVYLATAMDLQYDPACPERYAGARQELDSLRVAAVQKYLVALNAGRCSDFQVLLHDPADPSIATQGPAFSVQQMYSRFRGGLVGAGGGAGAAAGPSGSVGGFSGTSISR